MFFLAGHRVAVCSVMWTVPVRLPFCRPFLENGLAVRAEDVVPPAEALVENHGPLRDPLQTVLALLFICAMALDTVHGIDVVVFIGVASLGSDRIRYRFGLMLRSARPVVRVYRHED